MEEKPLILIITNNPKLDRTYSFDVASIGYNLTTSLYKVGENIEKLLEENLSKYDALLIDINQSHLIEPLKEKYDKPMVVLGAGKNNQYPEIPYISIFGHDFRERLYTAIESQLNK